ncbi:hypothetical protein B0H16DRAFT_1523163 [Mycena metata]|uniref:Uncharacterized protein n=1 Tax=Mycena metata TaxID=1033252 RepID=A0AAD7NM08_9AGAR|nr:hypothetical protein B0H16DRAFT_1523163 [Mycena metata]
MSKPGFSRPAARGRRPRQTQTIRFVSSLSPSLFLPPSISLSPTHSETRRVCGHFETRSVRAHLETRSVCTLRRAASALMSRRVASDYLFRSHMLPICLADVPSQAQDAREDTLLTRRTTLTPPMRFPRRVVGWLLAVEEAQARESTSCDTSKRG